MPEIPTAESRQPHAWLARDLSHKSGRTRGLVASPGRGSPLLARDPGAAFFAANCAMCHAPGADFPFEAKGRSAAELHEMLGRLDRINEMMPPLDATDEQRQPIHRATYSTNVSG